MTFFYLIQLPSKFFLKLIYVLSRPDYNSLIAIEQDKH
jgi:hypothetical protein